MRVPQYAKRSIATLALAALAAGCGGDSTAPDAPFDPAGTEADIGAIQSSFDSPVTAGFSVASGAVGTVLGESPAAAAVKAMPSKALVTGGRRGADHYAARIAQAYVKPAGAIRPSFSTAAIPAEYLGVTFVYDVETDSYQASELAGAPENGVRFVVYAVNPISGHIIEPLVEVGHADVVTTETASAVTVRIELVSEDVTFLDYSVGVSGSASAVSVTVGGFVSNGTDRVNFDLDTHITSASMQLDYLLVVPTRDGFRIDFEGEATEAGVTSSIEARGPHGTVAVSGNQNGGNGTFEVTVNGELFATITTVQGEEPVITGGDGQPLSQDEIDALKAVFGVFLQGFDFFEDLVDPIA